jgi:hypothetical protein
MQEMKPIRQNSLLKFWGLTLLFAGMLLSWWLGPALASIINIVGIILAFTGIDTVLQHDGIKLGFTKIKSDQVADVYEHTEGVIVVVTRDGHCYQLKRWHYRASEWSRVREHIFGLIGSQHKSAHTTAGNAPV